MTAQAVIIKTSKSTSWKKGIRIDTGNIPILITDTGRVFLENEDKYPEWLPEEEIVVIDLTSLL